MNNFFRYQDTLKNRDIYHNLTLFEWIIPIIIVYSMTVLIFVYKNTIIESIHLDLIFRMTAFILLAFLFVSHYVLNWIFNGFTIDYLPLQLCSISMVLEMILLCTHSKQIHAFVLFSGVLGGIVSLTVPLVGYSYHYFRYYQFMGSHILIVLIPIYYMVIYHYKPNFKSALKVLGILEILLITMTAFNTLLDTNYFYVTLSKETITDSKMVNFFGGIPWYVLNVNILGVIVFFIWHYIMQFLFNSQVRDNTAYIKMNSLLEEEH